MCCSPVVLRGCADDTPYQLVRRNVCWTNLRWRCPGDHLFATTMPSLRLPHWRRLTGETVCLMAMPVLNPAQCVALYALTCSARR